MVPLVLLIVMPPPAKKTYCITIASLEAWLKGFSGHRADNSGQRAAMQRL